MRAIFIIHGAKKKLREFPKRLSEINPKYLQFYFCFTSDFGSGKQIAYENAHRADVVVVVGGDGILNECLNGIIMYKRGNPELPVPALTLLPFGSGNDFARMMGWRNRSIPDLINKFENPNYLNFDVGRITYESGRVDYFLNEVSTGLATKVVERVERMPPSLSGDIKFGWAIIQCFLTFKKKTLHIKCEEFEWKGKAVLAVCCNGKYFGSGIMIAPDAQMDDGLLNIVIIGNVSIWDYLRNLHKLRKGIKIEHPEVHYFKAPKVHISAEWNVEKDGEMGGATPCEVSFFEKVRILA